VNSVLEGILKKSVVAYFEVGLLSRHSPARTEEYHENLQPR
jgi:hypothetical protein